MSVVAAVKMLHLSERQLYPLRQKVRAEGDSGIIHCLRGRSPANALQSEFQDQIVELYTSGRGLQKT